MGKLKDFGVVLSIFLRITDTDYLFGIFKLFLEQIIDNK
jgi:hypothetical protein